MNKAAIKTLEILEYLSALPQGGAGISEISRALDLPKSSVSEILYTLLYKDYVQYDNEPMKTFRLGLKAAQLGFSVIGRMDVLKAAHPMLEQLHTETGYTVLLTVENNGRALIIDKLEQRSAVQLSAVVGSAYPMHLTAAGKAILAMHTWEEVLSIVGEGCYEVRTVHSISNQYSLQTALAKVREQGYAEENLEENEYTCSIAAPIFDHSGKVCAAVSVSLLASDCEKTDFDCLIGKVLRCAKHISAAMGA